ncbi:MAG: transketolase C-terminal domain-containing protein, partial [Prochlorothrix sp.]
ARFVKPVDTEVIVPLALRFGKLVTLEEGCLMGGFGSAVLESLQEHDVLVPTLRLGVPDILVDHATPDQSKVELGLTPAQMADTILQKFGSAVAAPIAVS